MLRHICDKFDNKWKHTLCSGLFEIGCSFSFQRKKKPFHRRLTVAEHVLLRNDLNQDEFAEAVPVLLREGKYRNILLTGVAGCGKTLYKFSKLCFERFCNPVVRPRSLWLMLSVLKAMK